MANRRLRVLSIDDEPGINGIVKKAAEADGHEAIATADLGEFKQALGSWQPGAVIIDINMPGCDGVELLRYLSETRCTAPVFVFSGLDDRTLEAVLRIGQERGLKMAGKLSKPLRVADLQRALAEAAASEEGPLSADLAEAIRQNQLLLEYLPKLDCKLGRVTAVEALVRWEHPRRGRLQPNQFISVAEETGQMAALTDWVVSKAAQQAAAWHRQGMPIDVALNISPNNALDDTLPDRLAGLCRNHLAEPGWMILELAETGAMADALQMMDVLTRLRVKGFKLSIDDFGTGCSSLVQLQQMPFSEIKIDRSFVSRMMNTRDCAVIVEIVIELARKLGLRSVAAGVESKAILDRLAGLECDAVQGFYISPPVAADRVPALVRGPVPARAGAAA